MPYSIENPPEQIKGLPNHAKEIWISAFNSALDQYNDEGKASATAWAAVGKKYRKGEDGRWMAKADLHMDQKLSKWTNKILNEHRLHHAWYSALASKRVLRCADGSLMTMRQVADEHEAIVKQMVKDRITHYQTDKLDETLPKVLKKSSMPREYFKLPSDILVKRDFVSIINSASGIDVLLKAKMQESDLNLRCDNIILPMKKIFDPQKKGNLCLVNNPDGDCSNATPLYDLVLRKKGQLKPLLLKDSAKLNLGCGKKSLDGYIGIDKEPFDEVDLVWDLEEGIPFQKDSVSEIQANQILEYLPNPDAIMREIHRVLIDGGLLKFKVTPAKDNGTFADSNHKSRWNKNVFASWVLPQLLGDRPKFCMETIKEYVQDDNTICVEGILKADKNFVMPENLVGDEQDDDFIKIKSTLNKDRKKQIIYCVVMEPNENDMDDDYSSVEDIEEAAHDYLANYRTVRLSHGRIVNGDVVESHCTWFDFEFNGQKIRKGTWIAGIKIHDAGDWNRVEKGEILGFSVGGTKQYYNG